MENELTWTQGCCKKNAKSGENILLKEMGFCEEHGCQMTEFAHFVLTFVCQKRKGLKVTFVPRFENTGTRRGCLASGVLCIGDRCQSGELGLFDIYLRTEDECREMFTRLAHMCIMGDSCMLRIPTYKELDVKNGDTQFQIACAYHTFMEGVVWRRMSSIASDGMLPQMMVATMTKESIPYHIEWDARTMKCELMVVKCTQEERHDRQMHVTPTFIAWRLHNSAMPHHVDLLPGGMDGQYMVCGGDPAGFAHRMEHYLPLRRMILRNAHPLEEPHRPPVLLVAADVVVSPDDQDDYNAICSTIRGCVGIAASGPSPITIPKHAVVCPLACRSCSWIQWSALRHITEGTCVTMRVFFLIRGGHMLVPMYDTDTTPALLPCILARPEDMKHGHICLQVVPPNVPICWQASQSGRHGAYVYVRAHGVACGQRMIYFASLST